MKTNLAKTLSDKNLCGFKGKEKKIESEEIRSKSTKRHENGENNKGKGNFFDCEEEIPKKLTVKQAKKAQSSKQLIEKEIKKTAKEIEQINKETKKLLWDEEREVFFL